MGINCTKTLLLELKIANPLLAQSLTNLPTAPQILPPSKPPDLHENRNNPPSYSAPAALPRAPSPLSPPPPCSAVQQMLSDVMAQGSPEDVAAALPLMSVCPVVHNNQGQHVHESLPLAMFKELKKKCS